MILYAKATPLWPITTNSWWGEIQVYHDVHIGNQIPIGGKYPLASTSINEIRLVVIISIKILNNKMNKLRQRLIQKFTPLSKTIFISILFIQKTENTNPLKHTRMSKPDVLNCLHIYQLTLVAGGWLDVSPFTSESCGALSLSPTFS